jgi:magnesium-transporting ATPase (P-type)
VGLPGYDSMPAALTRLSKQDRVGYCNSFWEGHFTRLATLEFSRDRKMMSVLCTRKAQEVLFVKVRHTAKPTNKQTNKQTNKHRNREENVGNLKQTCESINQRGD